MAKMALVIYGPPGSGKGTQANLVAGRLNLVHFDTGRYLREYLYDPANAKKTLTKRERNFYEAGKIMTPSFVSSVVLRGVTRIAKAGYGVVFSGSPRTLYEAKKLLPILEKLYGRSRLRFVVLSVNPETSLKRNSSRVLCEFCDLTILITLLPHPKHLKSCPFCGSRLKKRSDDNPKVIKVRLKEYESRTRPVFGFLKKRGYSLHMINGEPLPYKVSTAILQSLKVGIKATG